MSKTPLQELVQLRTGRDIETLLRELYVERRYSDQEIAEAWGVTRAVVNLWRRQFGIDRDDREPLVPVA